MSRAKWKWGKCISLIQDGGDQYITFLLSCRSCCHEIIWNNYIEIHWKNMQVMIIIFRCTLWYNCLGDLTRQHEVWRKKLLHYINTNWSDRKHRIFLQTKSDAVCLFHWYQIKLMISPPVHIFNSVTSVRVFTSLVFDNPWYSLLVIFSLRWKYNVTFNHCFPNHSWPEWMTIHIFFV